MTMRGRSMVGIPSLLEDVHFSLEAVTKVLEDTLTSESKECIGVKLEVVQDLDITDRHKVIEVTTFQPKQSHVPTFGK